MEAKAEAMAKLTDAIEKWDERSKKERDERLQKMSQKPESLIEQQAISAALAALSKPGPLASTVISSNIRHFIKKVAKASDGQRYPSPLS